MLPAPALCQSLQLTNRRGEWDFYDHDGEMASLYRETPESLDELQSHLLYLRSDLLSEYLADTDKTLVWLTWGERGFDQSHHEMVELLGSDYRRYANIHKRFHLLDDFQ